MLPAPYSNRIARIAIEAHRPIIYTMPDTRGRFRGARPVLGSAIIIAEVVVSTIKASELKGRAVVSLAEAEKVGTVSSLIFDPSANKVVGLKVKTGLFGGPQTLRADDIRNIGPDAVTINDRNLLRERESEVPDLKDMPTLEDLLSMKVVGDNGVLHGMLGDVEIDPEDMTITEYEMSGSLWDHIRAGGTRLEGRLRHPIRQGYPHCARSSGSDPHRPHRRSGRAHGCG